MFLNNLLIQLELYINFHRPDQNSTGICPRASAKFAAWNTFELQVTPFCFAIDRHTYPGLEYCQCFFYKGVDNLTASLFSHIGS